MLTIVFNLSTVLRSAANAVHRQNKTRLRNQGSQALYQHTFGKAAAANVAHRVTVGLCRGHHSRHFFARPLAAPSAFRFTPAAFPLAAPFSGAAPVPSAGSIASMSHTGNASTFAWPGVTRNSECPMPMATWTSCSTCCRNLKLDFTNHVLWLTLVLWLVLKLGLRLTALLTRIDAPARTCLVSAPSSAMHLSGFAADFRPVGPYPSS